MKQDPPPLLLIMEFMQGGSLTDLLRKHNSGLPICLLYKLALHIASGLHCIHTKHLIHRDIKPDNILLSDQSASAVAKIAGMQSSLSFIFLFLLKWLHFWLVEHQIWELHVHLVQTILQM